MKEIVQNVLIALVIGLVVLLLILTFVGINDRNREKVERMTELCVSNGYAAWADGMDISSCIGERRES